MEHISFFQWDGEGLGFVVTDLGSAWSIAGGRVGPLGWAVRLGISVLGFAVRFRCPIRGGEGRC